MDVQVRVGALIEIARPPPALRDLLRERLTRSSRQRRGRYWVNLDISAVGVSPSGALTLPRGALDQLRDAATTCGVDLSWESTATPARGPGVPLDRLGIPLRPYQRIAVEQMLVNVQMLVELPCGGGKTTIGAAALLALGAPALVVVPSIDLVEQWVETLRAMGARRVFILGRQRVPDMEPGDVVLTIPTALQKRDGDQLRILRTVGALLVDECHRSPCKTWADLLVHCPARYRWGLTATAERADGLGWLLPLLFGRQLIPATVQELVAAGWLILPEILPVWTSTVLPWACWPLVFQCDRCLTRRPIEIDPALAEDHRVSCRRAVERDGDRTTCGGQYKPTGDLDALLWSRAVGLLADDAGRNAQTLELATAAATAGRTALVLVPEVEQAHLLADRLLASGIAAEALTGRESRKARKAILARARARQLQVLLATTVADEGLDVPVLDCLILAAPGRARGKAIQRVGRTMRPGGMVPLVLDQVDPVRELISQWTSRRRGYATILGDNCILARDPVHMQVALNLIRDRTEPGRIAG